MVDFFNTITTFIYSLTQSYCIYFNKKNMNEKYTEIIVDDLYDDLDTLSNTNTNTNTNINTNTNTNTKTECTIEPPQLSWAIDDV